MEMIAQIKSLIQSIYQKYNSTNTLLVSINTEKINDVVTIELRTSNGCYKYSEYVWDLKQVIDVLLNAKDGIMYFSDSDLIIRSYDQSKTEISMIFKYVGPLFSTY